MTPEADPACPSERLPSLARSGPVSHALTRVARLHRIAAGKALRQAGLYAGQETVMMRLWQSGPVRQSDLIRMCELDPSTITKMLQRLEQSGHVRRCPDPADRRAVLVEATEDSCALYTDVTRTWGELEEHTLAGLDPAERAELGRLLARVEQNLCTETADCPGPAAGPAAQPESTSSALSTSASEL
ncbi:MarR family winged helix-turn-helix transcriptional regulator [Streptomyces sp. NPDC057445]|uniref:MarR family winged helix-turn-helix transcriptional regulator n=1 Tax=Streptomyces sp. NPDC057445 TaxID=3346136 RepID=UPI0036C790BC